MSNEKHNKALIFELEKQQTQLRNQLKEIESAISVIKKTNFVFSEFNQQEIAIENYNSEKLQLSLIDMTLEYLKKENRPRSTQEISDNILQAGKQTSSQNFRLMMRTVLYQLKTKNKIKSPYRGYWQII